MPPVNDIEKMFYDAYICEYVNPENKLCCTQEIEPQVVIGIYKVDFVINGEFVIEIDGHAWHNTKEQREQDYKRERYLLKNGYTVIRFMGTEIFLSCNLFAKETLMLVETLIMRRFDDSAFYDQYKSLKSANKIDFIEKNST